jgi:hypothetical protein
VLNTRTHPVFLPHLSFLSSFLHIVSFCTLQMDYTAWGTPIETKSFHVAILKRYSKLLNSKERQGPHLASSAKSSCNHSRLPCVQFEGKGREEGTRRKEGMGLKRARSEELLSKPIQKRCAKTKRERVAVRKSLIGTSHSRSQKASFSSSFDCPKTNTSQDQTMLPDPSSKNAAPPSYGNLFQEVMRVSVILTSHASSTLCHRLNLPSPPPPSFQAR